MVLETLVKKKPQLVHPPFGLGEFPGINYQRFLYKAQTEIFRMAAAISATVMQTGKEIELSSSSREGDRTQLLLQ